MAGDTDSMERAIVIGAGSIGVRHHRVLEGLGLDVYMVSRRADAGDFTSVGEAARAVDPGYVVVATETERHRESLMALVEANYKARVLLEKPVLDRVEPFPANGFRSISVGYQLRFHPAVCALRRAIEGQRILSAQVRYGQFLPDWRPTRDYRETVTAGPAGGVLLELSHELDLISWLLGSATVQFGRVMSTGLFDMERDDLVVGILETASGALVGLELNCHDRVQNRTFIVTTDQHHVALDLVAGRVVVDGQAVFDDPVERDAVFASMHRSVMGGGTEACTIGEALAVLSLAECLRGE